MVNSQHADNALLQLKGMIFNPTSKSKERQWYVRNFKITSYTRTNSSHVGTVEYLIRKYMAS
jgi:hypothetical protein